MDYQKKHRSKSNLLLVCLKTAMFLQFCLFLNQHIFAHEQFQLYDDTRVLKINPVYKIKRLSTGVVIASTKLSNGEVIKHEFRDLYAEILLAAYRKQSIKQVISVMLKKYFYNEDECRREIKHAINVLTEWNILLNVNKTG